MSDTILESYLVRLGATVDSNSFNKFDATLKQSDKLVGNFSLDTIGYFGKMEAAAIGVFSSIGAGVIALADKTAMADQQYQLFGQRMLMDKDSARSLSMALEDLGITLDEAAFNPELHMRLESLLGQYNRLGESLNLNFNKNMVGIRDLRMEYKIFGRELEFLAMNTVSTLFDDLGLGSGNLLKQLERFNNWFTQNIPAWSKEISKDLTPVLNDVWVILGDTKDIAEALGLEFTNLVGIFSDDNSIEGATFDFHKFAVAVEHVAHGVAILVHWMAKLEEIAIRFLPVFAGMTGGAAIGGVIGTIAGIEGGPVGMLAGGAAGSAIGGLAGGLTGGAVMLGEEGVRYKGGSDQHGAPSHTSGPASSIALQAREEAQKVSADTGIPADLIWSQWAVETRGFQSKLMTGMNNLGGIMKHGTQDLEAYDSLDDYAKAYERSIERPRYTSHGLNDSKNAEQFAHALGSGNYFGDASESDYAGGIKRYQREYASLPGTQGDVNINGDIHITVPPHTSPDDAKKIVTGAIADYAKKSTRNTTAQTAGGVYF